MALCKVCSQDMVVQYYDKDEPVLACGHLQSKNQKLMAVEYAIYESERDIAEKIDRLGCTRDEAQDMQIRECAENMPKSHWNSVVTVLRGEKFTKDCIGKI